MVDAVPEHPVVGGGGIKQRAVVVTPGLDWGKRASTVLGNTVPFAAGFRGFLRAVPGAVGAAPNHQNPPVRQFRTLRFEGAAARAFAAQDGARARLPRVIGGGGVPGANHTHGTLFKHPGFVFGVLRGVGASQKMQDGSVGVEQDVVAGVAVVVLEKTKVEWVLRIELFPRLINKLLRLGPCFPKVF